MENKRMGCINRDKNTVKNMIKLTNYYLEHIDQKNLKKVLNLKIKKFLKIKKHNLKLI